MQTLQSLALIQGLPSTALCDVPPELQDALAALSQKLLTAASAGQREQERETSCPSLTAPGQQLPAAEAALEEEARRLAAALEAQQRRKAAAEARAQQSLARAEERQGAVGKAVRALADQLAPLEAALASQEQLEGGPVLLSLGVPQDVAASRAKLLQGLSDLLDGCGMPGGGAGQLAPASEQEVGQQVEFERLQAALQLAASAKVEAQVGAARAEAELAYLQQHIQGGPVPLGQDVEELEREVQQLQRKLQASLERCRGTAAQASQQHAAAAVARQSTLRVEATRERCARKRQVLDLLIKHAARQALLGELLRQEHAALGQVHGLVQAALEDGRAVVDSTQQRLSGRLYATPGQRADFPDTSPRAEAAAQQPLPPELLQALCEVAGGGCSEAEAPDRVAGELLQLREGVSKRAEQVQRELLPAQRAVFARLHGLVFRGGDVSAPVLTAPGVQEKLAAAAASKDALQQAATAALVEATQRQQQGQRQALQEQVLVDFWANPANLAKRAEQQQRALQG